MLLADLVETSEPVASTRSRLAKVDALVDAARPPRARRDRRRDRVPRRRSAAGTRRHRVGDDPRPRRRRRRREPTLTIDDVVARDRRRPRRNRRRVGARAARASSPTSSRAQPQPEADFLRRLLLGELRQGALEGVMTDAIARARRRAARGRAARRDAQRRPRVTTASSHSRTVWTRSPRCGSSCCGRSNRCSRRPPRTSRLRSKQPDRRRSSGSSTARGSRCTAPDDEVAGLHPQPQRGHRPTARSRRRGAHVPGAHVGARRRGDRLSDDERPHRFQDTMSRFGRQQRRRARHPAHARSSSTCCASTTATCSTNHLRHGSTRSASIAGERTIPSVRTDDPGAAAEMLDDRARRRPRRRDGEGARRRRTRRAGAAARGAR